MTAELDLSSLAGPTLTFSAWFDVEPWYDWGYVSVSTDNGLTWTALAGEHTTDENPVGHAYGAGYTGASGGGEPAWVNERLDLDAYAGQANLLLRFEYVTDGGTHHEGWAVRNVAVHSGESRIEPVFETDGWVYVDQPLPQAYEIRQIAWSADGSYTVLGMVLDADQRGEMTVLTDHDDIIVAVAGTTEGTNQSAPYTIELLVGP
jgi:hypothetical protein